MYYKMDETRKKIKTVKMESSLQTRDSLSVLRKHLRRAFVASDLSSSQIFFCPFFSYIVFQFVTLIPRKISFFRSFLVSE